MLDAWSKCNSFTLKMHLNCVLILQSDLLGQSCPILKVELKYSYKLYQKTSEWSMYLKDEGYCHTMLSQAVSTNYFIHSEMLQLQHKKM